jgi:hypothetical protein
VDVIIIFNGLGNQMSQYAFYLKKKALNSSTIALSFGAAHNGYELDKVFGIPSYPGFTKKVLYLIFRVLVTDKAKIIIKPLQRLLNIVGCKIIKENYNYNYNEAFLAPSKGITFYFGGFPSEKYFVSEKEDILKKYKFIRPDDNVENIHDILTTQSVAIHVRRGDYFNAENIGLFGEVCNAKYFHKAMDFIEGKVNQPHYFVFSNDIEWVKKNLDIKNVTFITYNKGQNSWKDMYLMSLCKHNIIANSSFSWWGAWLNQNPGKIVVSPSRYLNNDEFTDFYPESWIRLSY